MPGHVRRATPNDLPEVLALADALGDDLHVTLDELAAALADPTWHVWVAGEAEPLSLHLHRSGDALDQRARDPRGRPPPRARRDPALGCGRGLVGTISTPNRSA